MKLPGKILLLSIVMVLFLLLTTCATRETASETEKEALAEPVQSTEPEQPPAPPVPWDRMLEHLKQGRFEEFQKDIPHMEEAGRIDPNEGTLIHYLLLKAKTKDLSENTIIEMLKGLKNRGTDIYLPHPKYKRNALYYSLKPDRLEIAAWLIKQYRQENRFEELERENFWLEKFLKHPEVIIFLLNYNPRVDKEILMDTMTHKEVHYEVFKVLLESKPPEEELNELAALSFYRGTVKHSELLKEAGAVFTPDKEDIKKLFLFQYNPGKPEEFSAIMDIIQRDYPAYMPVITDSIKLYDSIKSGNEKKALSLARKKDLAPGITEAPDWKYFKKSFLSLAIESKMYKLADYLVKKNLPAPGLPSGYWDDLNYPLTIWANQKEAPLSLGKLLVKNGADVNYPTPTTGIAAARDIWILAGCRPLISAIYGGDFEKVKFLVEAGADVNYKGEYRFRSPLKEAEKQESDAIYKYLESQI